MVHKKRYQNDAESAAAELLSLRSDLADAKAGAGAAEKGWHANEARGGKLESQLAWWLETYDITMPCGHKNRYLLTDGRGELIKEGNGDCVCVMCQLELSDKIEEILKSQ